MATFTFNVATLNQVYGKNKCYILNLFINILKCKPFLEVNLVVFIYVVLYWCFFLLGITLKPFKLPV